MVEFVEHLQAGFLAALLQGGGANLVVLRWSPHMMFGGGDL